MIKYINIFRLVLRCLLVARKENLTGVSTGFTGRSKNFNPTGNPTGAGRPDQIPSLISTPSLREIMGEIYVIYHQYYHGISVRGFIRPCPPAPQLKNDKNVTKKRILSSVSVSFSSFAYDSTCVQQYLTNRRTGSRAPSIQFCETI